MRIKIYFLWCSLWSKGLTLDFFVLFVRWDLTAEITIFGFHLHFVSLLLILIKKFPLILILSS